MFEPRFNLEDYSFAQTNAVREPWANSAVILSPTPNPSDRWQVEANLLEAAKGVAVVELRLINELMGALPAIRLSVPWQAGLEPADVETQALLLAAQSAGALKEACLQEGVRRRMSGEPGAGPA